MDDEHGGPSHSCQLFRPSDERAHIDSRILVPTHETASQGVDDDQIHAIRSSENEVGAELFDLTRLMHLDRLG